MEIYHKKTKNGAVIDKEKTIKDSMHIYILMRKVTLAGAKFRKEETYWSDILLEREELALDFRQSLHGNKRQSRICGHGGQRLADMAVGTAEILLSLPLFSQ